MDTVLTTVYGLFCAAGIALDVHSMVSYLVRRRRPGWPPPIPLAGLILYVLAGMWRMFLQVEPLMVRWELLALVGLHAVAHAVVPLADRAWMKAATRGQG